MVGGAAEEGAFEPHSTDVEVVDGWVEREVAEHDFGMLEDFQDDTDQLGRVLVLAGSTGAE